MVVSLAAAGMALLVIMPLPIDMRLIVCFDLATTAYIGLFLWLMSIATPEDCAELSTRRSRRKNLHLVLMVLVSLVGAGAITVLSRPDNAPPSLRLVHYAASLLAICLGWLVAHIAFGLHYMGLYYHDSTPDDVVLYDEGMTYPERKMPDYWDFMYYSFTIAMCYQTSDVTITTTKVRRVTLLHAIFSFFFVAAIFGLVVNILSNII